jgi:hypothetical protein
MQYYGKLRGMKYMPQPSGFGISEIYDNVLKLNSFCREIQASDLMKTILLTMCYVFPIHGIFMLSSSCMIKSFLVSIAYLDIDGLIGIHNAFLHL